KRAYCLKTQPATGETYPKSDLFNKALLVCRCRLDGIKEAPEGAFYITVIHKVLPAYSLNLFQYHLLYFTYITEITITQTTLSKAACPGINRTNRYIPITISNAGTR
ncbi:hypothetical protein, partial [Enterobacter roggenkampii]|uniref:hypothetical protein n=1 Tax=Enterobacter roggenkampii TaxID=1812935 RepID=UPI001C8C0C3A